MIAWSLRGLDELDLFPSPLSRDQALGQLRRESRGRDIALGIVAMVGVAIAVAFGSRSAIASFWPAAPSTVRDEFRIALTIAVAVLTLRWLHRRGAASALRGKLLLQGVAVCLQCGQSLRGLPSGTRLCPECGAGVSDGAAALVDGAGTGGVRASGS